MRESQLRLRANQTQGLPLIFQYRFIAEFGHVLDQKTNEWQWKTQPVEDVSPKKHGDFPTVTLVN